MRYYVVMEQLDSLHIRLSNIETQISQPTNDLARVVQGELSQINNNKNLEEHWTCTTISYI